MQTKRIVIGVAAFAAVVAGGYGLYASGVRHGAAAPAQITADAAATAATSTKPATDGDAGSTAGRKPLYWHDPMVPGTKFDKPGKSPFMDMQLVPVYAEADDEGGGVTINARTQQNLGVRTVDVITGSLAPAIEAVGSVAWNERDVAVVSARAAGFVEKLFRRAPLDAVSRGEPLVELYVPDWVAAQEEFLSVRRMAAASGASGDADLVDAARQRMRLAGMTDEQIARVEEGGAVRARTTITAPIAGVISEIGVREGSSVTAGMPMMRISGLSTVWVNAEVPEAAAASIKRGIAVVARTPSGVQRGGKVAAILPEVNPTTRTIKVRIELANADRQLVPGMFVTLRFRPASRSDALLIPSEALITTGTRHLVMVAQDGGRFMPVEVVPGMESNGQVEIKQGLQAGQRVVASGQFLVDSEASLKGVAARLGGATDAPPADGAPR